MKTILIKTALITIFYLFILSTEMAGPGGPGGGPGTNPPVGGNTPLDGGAIFLLIAGAAYGIKQIKNSRKQKNDC